MERKTSLSFLIFIKKSKLLKNGGAPLYLRITVNGKIAECSLHISVNPDLWNSKNGYLEGNSKEAQSKNKFIDSVKFKLQSIINDFNNTGIDITANIVKQKYLGITTKSITIISAFERHNEHIEALKNIDFAPGTILHYKTTLSHLQAFILAEFSTSNVSIHSINYEFITNFELYLKTECKCSHNTAMKHLSRLKKVLNIELKKGNLEKDPFVSISIRSHKTNRDYLTQKELNQIINKKFNTQRVEQVKDCFLFSCFTGLAYAEIKSLKTENIVLGIDGKKWISINRKKSKANNICNVPILPLAQEILNKYSDHPIIESKDLLLPVITNQKMNEYLKEIADLCGITKNLTSHIARHTFATTVTLNNGVPIESVSKMLGHSDLKTTKIYAKLLDNRISQDMKKVKRKYS